MSSTGLEKLKRIVEVVHLSDRIVDPPELIDGLLDVFSQCFHTDQMIFMYQLTQTGPPTFARRNLPERSLSDYIRYYHSLDPFKILSGPPEKRRLRAGPLPRKNVLMLRELVHYPSFQNTEYYHDFWRPQYLSSELGSFLNSREGVLGYVGLFRSRGEADFSEKDANLLRLASPYVALTLENLKLREKAKIDRIVAATVEDRARIGVLILSEKLKLLQGNSPAFEFCRNLGEDPKSFGCAARDGSSHILGGCVRIKQKQKITPLAYPTALVRDIPISPSKMYHVHTQYMKSSHSFLGMKNVFVIRIEVIETRPILDNSHLEEVFRLTGREMEIVRFLFEGCKNSEIADKLFITEITVKKHIQNICGKMGVRSRTAIVSKAVKSMNGIGSAD